MIGQKMEPDVFHRIGEDVMAPLWHAGRLYWCLLGVSLGLILLGGFLWTRMLEQGLGLLGIGRPGGWGIDITTFVFWVGITHSGTLISAIFYLFGVPWRAFISRMAEAMTVFAIMTAGVFPILHLGRPWFFYWLFPFPNARQLPVNFRSPLIWDVIAITTYLTVSFLFWYMGMVPDLAAIRDRSTGMKKRIYGIFALGWRGTSGNWRHFRSAYLFLASLSIPLAVSVHSVVSWDFAVGIVPGWHSTIFAPYFVAGAIFSGIAMLCVLVILIRGALKLERYILVDHFDKLARLLLCMSLILSYVYVTETFITWYSGDPIEIESLRYRAFGDYTVLFWTMIGCNSVFPLLLFFRKVRRNLKSIFVIAFLAVVGMYLERFLIVPVSLVHGFDPSLWRVYKPTFYEYGLLAASFGFFSFLYLLFIKFIPAVPIYEVKELVHAHPHKAPEAVE